LKTLAIVYGYVDDSTYSECGRLADKWVGFERSFGNKGIYSVYYWIWRPYIAALSRNAGKILRVFLQKGMPLEHKARIISVLVTSYKMEALLSETGARIFWTSIEGNDPWSVAGALAANRKGGVSLGSTWSAFRYLSYSAQRVTNDVLFIWGKRHIEIFRRAGTVCGSMVIAGYPGDVYLGEFNSRSDELRKSWLGSYGRKMTICFYTNVFGNNDESLYSVAMDFLGKLFEWALRRDDVLLIVKQKRDEMSRETFPKVKELMERLVEERKLILADNKGDMSPGLASDIVLGIGSATLPLLLGSYGKDVQIIDANRMKERSPLIAGKISFLPGPSEAMEKLESWASSRHDDASPRGDRAFTPNEMDSFADGRAAHRITQYLLDVKDILGKGDGDAAIEGAGERYARKWGKDKIVRA
jgi:hypothetical protein